MVKPGYKQTEIGEIPEDWEVKELQQISPKQSVGLVINPSTYFDAMGTVPMLVGSNIYENFIDISSVNYITEESNNNLPASRLYTGDIVTVRVGFPGTTAVISQELNGCNCASMMIIRKSDEFDSDWLCAIMNSHIGRNQIEGVQYGTAQKQFNISDAIHFIFPVPPLPEQQRIAEALSDVDALIASLEKMIAKKKAIKQGAMQRLLTGKTRLPGFEGKLKKTELGEIPEDWEVVKLGSIAEIHDGTHQTPHYVPYGIPFYSVEHVTNRNFTNTKYIDESEHNFLTRYFRIEKGDILMTRIGSIGECVLIDWDVNASFYVSLALLKVYGAYAPYIASYSETSAFKKEVELHSLPFATPKKINLGPIASIRVLVPSKMSEQVAIADFLSNMNKEIESLTQKLAKTRQLKQGMMQQLLTGKIRLV